MSTMPRRCVLSLLLFVTLLGVRPVAALVRFDFETPYLVQPGDQIWDFSLIQDAGQYHIFYHTIAQHGTQHPANADTIWHAESVDLVHWSQPASVLTAGPGWYDEVAIWAPNVVRDSTSGRWAMLYTGVAQRMVQRPCLAWSSDLVTWTKSAANPVFEPDSLVYHWAPQQAWASFRDPFVYHDGMQWNMLSTAGLRLGGYPGYRRGIVHRAVSADLVHWQDAGPFFTHDGAVGRGRDLESAQYVVRNGWHHLFFVEQNLALESAPTFHMSATDPAGWTMSQVDTVDAGWAPEIGRFAPASAADVFSRLAKDQDPRDGSWFVTVRFDSVRYENQGQTPVVFAGDALGADWPTRTGVVGAVAPTFGENAQLRGAPAPLGIEGHGWFSSLENYGGPLSGVGFPGAALGDSAVGRLESRPFVITGDYLRLLIAGGYYPGTCYVALLDDATGAELSRVFANDVNRMSERIWSLLSWRGRTVRLAIVDQETGPDGWLAVDGIEERLGNLSGVGEAPRGALALRAYPNPFNPRTKIRFRAPKKSFYQLEIYDLAGRRVWRSDGQQLEPGGSGRVIWQGQDVEGRPVASGTFLCRIMADGRPLAQLPITLVR